MESPVNSMATVTSIEMKSSPYRNPHPATRCPSQWIEFRLNELGLSLHFFRLQLVWVSRDDHWPKNMEVSVPLNHPFIDGFSIVNQLWGYHHGYGKPHFSQLVGGWPTPPKNDGVKVSWDDYSIPFPTVSGKSCHPVMFQSAPTRYIVIPTIDHRLTIG